MADPTGFTESASPYPTPGGVTTAPTTAPDISINGDAPEHKPYIPDEANVPEFTWLPVLMGALLGIVFGASSLYLVLKVGLTVSASIPVAVLSITLFRGFAKVFKLRAATILENNIVQTTGSAGESIAFGVGVTMPALMLLGFEMNVGRVLVVSVLGGLLGILMMIPLRRAFIVKQHGKLKYPEGTACAEVLKAGDKGGATALTVFIGFGIAFVYEFFRLGFKWFKEVPDKSLKWFKGAVPAIEVNPALLGVGYIIGPRISAVMAAGGVLSAFVLIPAIRFFGDGLSGPLSPGTTPIKDMTEDDIWHAYVLYIGAGAVAAGGIISVFQALPLIFSSIKSGLADLARSGGNGDGGKRTDRDMPLWIVGVGALVLVGAIWATTPLHNTSAFSWVPDLQMHLLGAILIVIFGFLFVTVSSRLTGEIGSSSNPISGMTVATLLLTCLIFVALGMTRLEDRLTALSVAAVVCIAASNGGTTSQDLKTGFLVGATPKYQQWAILIGSLSSALVIGVILIQLNKAYTVYSAKNLPALKQAINMDLVKEKAETSKAPGDDTLYHVWRAPEQNEQGVPPGAYLVDDEGKLHYLVDPGINGRLSRRDDGSEVTRFKAPKATLMSLITDGILRKKLPWGLVLLGVSIAIVLELCGVPSLAFAVGVYLPLSSSTPIFVGGMARYIADRWGRRDTAGKTTEQLELEAESSPGSLLSTGYIAGGAIAGVLIAFLSFSDSIPRWLAFSQYRTTALPADMKYEDAIEATALKELGYRPEMIKVPAEIEAKQKADIPLNKDEKDIVEAVADRKDDVAKISDEIGDLNSGLKQRFIKVPTGFTVKLPGKESFETPAEGAMTLGQVALKKYGSENQAASLFDLNMETLIVVPAGKVLLLPDRENGQKAAKKEPGPASVAALAGLLAAPLGQGPLAVAATAYPGSMHPGTDDKVYVNPAEMTLAEVTWQAAAQAETPGEALILGGGAGLGAKAVVVKPYNVNEMYKLNKKELEPEVTLPKDTTLKVPQHTWPAMLAFGLLTAFLIVVGLGLLFRVPKNGGA